MAFQHVHTLSLRCRHCKEVFDSDSGFLEHLRQHHHGNTVRCTICTGQFPTKNELENHVVSNAVYKCVQCMNRFVTREALDLHTPSKHARGISYCADETSEMRDCMVSFATNVGRDPNMHSLNDNEDFQHTSNTQESFSPLSTGNGDTSRTDASRLVVACRFCEKNFSTKSNMYKHLRRQHANKLPYRCMQCKNPFGSVRGLTKHIWSRHSQDNSFDCSFCTCQFASIGELRIHWNTHDFDDPCTRSSCDETLVSSIGSNEHYIPHGGSTSSGVAEYPDVASSREKCAANVTSSRQTVSLYIENLLTAAEESNDIPPQLTHTSDSQRRSLCDMTLSKVNDVAALVSKHHFVACDKNRLLYTTTLGAEKRCHSLINKDGLNSQLNGTNINRTMDETVASRDCARGSTGYEYTYLLHAQVGESDGPACHVIVGGISEVFDKLGGVADIDDVVTSAGTDEMHRQNRCSSVENTKAEAARYESDTMGVDKMGNILISVLKIEHLEDNPRAEYVGHHCGLWTRSLQSVLVV